MNILEANLDSESKGEPTPRPRNYMDLLINIQILILTVTLGLIPAAIASSKGRSFFAWWFWEQL